LAIAFGGSAAIGINMLRNQEPAAPRGDTVTVLVAAKDVQRGLWISADFLATKEYPRELVPEGAILHKEDAVERTALVPLVKDELVLEAKLASRYAGRGLAPLIPDGMRAITITTNISSAVAGFILPGNHVDVLLSMSDVGPNPLTGGATTTTLLQNVEILAVDQHMDTPADNKIDINLRSVTLLVTADQAAKLQLGQTKGQLHLTLRNPNDSKDARAKPATLADIQFHQEKPWDERLKGVLETYAKMAAAKREQEASKPAPAAPAAAQAVIRTLRGTAEGMVIVPR
jgi:pilus assembly protein CpaB